MTIKERLTKLGLELPPPMRIDGQRFETVLVVRERAIISGHLPFDAGGKLARPLGKVGADVNADEAYQAARRVALGMIASLDAVVNLDRVAWRRVFGMVNAAPGFNALPGVINGFSDVVLEVFGSKFGKHARSAIGVAELPFGVPVEVEAEVALIPAGVRQS